MLFLAVGFADGGGGNGAACLTSPFVCLYVVGPAIYLQIRQIFDDCGASPSADIVDALDTVAVVSAGWTTVRCRRTSKPDCAGGLLVGFFCVYLSRVHLCEGSVVSGGKIRTIDAYLAPSCSTTSPSVRTVCTLKVPRTAVQGLKQSLGFLLVPAVRRRQLR